MALRPPRDPGRRLVRVAAVVAGLSILALLAVVVVTMRGNDGPEDAVAVDYLEAFYAGAGDDAYELVAPQVRAVVLPRELDQLADAARRLVGAGVEVETVGSRREGVTSLVGYRGASAVGAVEGLVTLVEIDGAWRVLEATYRFPDARPAMIEPFERAVATLNDQVRSRLGG